MQRDADPANAARSIPIHSSATMAAHNQLNNIGPTLGVGPGANGFSQGNTKGTSGRQDELQILDTERRRITGVQTDVRPKLCGITLRECNR